MSEKKEVSKDTAKRLIKDIKQMKKEPIDGIYYKHDENNMLIGYALIIGPEDTPYEGGYDLFVFEFPLDYPYSPPKLKYSTNDGTTRMHPNLYKNGKVCLSILNTWSGDAWTGCQTISSILLTIRSIMTNDPLLHEPGITKNHRDFDTYTEIVRYKNISLAMIDVIKNNNYFLIFGDLLDIAKKDYADNYEKKLKILQQSKIIFNNNTLINKTKCLYTSIYNMSCDVDYDTLEEEIKQTKILISINPKK